jgi:hypothetical protein
VGRIYLIASLGVLLFVLTVLEVLLGLRIVRFKGPVHWKIHRYNAYAILAIAAIHGTLALGTFVFGWF